MVPAIVLGTHTMGLGVIRALGKMGVPVIAVTYDHKDMGYSSKYVMEKIAAPHPEQSEEEFLNLLVGVATRYRGCFLVPVSDLTLEFVSKSKEILQQFCIVASTEWQITSKFLHKKHTHAIADSIGIPAPKTVTISRLLDLENIMDEITFPCLIKPSQSHRFFEKFNQKMTIASNFDQMWQECEVALEAGLEIMLQEIIPGDDSEGANYNSYFWDGQPLVEFTAQQIRNAPQNYGSPCVVLSKKIPEVIDAGRRILKAMGFYGYSCTEFKFDRRDGIYKLMEVNGRHNLSTQLAVTSGINFPWIHYQHLVNGVLPSPQEFRERVYWIDCFRDITNSPRAMTKGKKSIVDFLHPYYSEHVFAVFDLNDLKPFITRVVALLRRAGSALLRRDGHLKKLRRFE
jgi:D-aspartate ligase